MNRLYVSHFFSSLVIILIQIVLLRNIQIEFLDRFTLTIFIYPAVIIFLPVSSRRSVIILLAFAVGLLLDMFFDSPGVHAATLVFTAFIRSFILQILEPRQGYRNNVVPGPKEFGLTWFLRYLGILLFIHIFIFFSIDAFTFVYILKIFVNTVCSFFLSYLILILYKGIL